MSAATDAYDKAIADLRNLRDANRLAEILAAQVACAAMEAVFAEHGYVKGGKYRTIDWLNWRGEPQLREFEGCVIRYGEACGRFFVLTTSGKRHLGRGPIYTAYRYITEAVPA